MGTADTFSRSWAKLMFEKSMKREDQQGATVRCLLLTSVSTCFGHHYAHLQENNGHVIAFGVVLVLLDVIGSG